MAVVGSAGLPVAKCIESASSHEVTLVEKTLENRFVQEQTRPMIGDKTYDSERHD